MPKVVDHEGYRRELAEKSFEVFARLGFAACTMRVLANELQVSTGTLYHYFATKEDVFAYLVRYKAAQQDIGWAHLLAQPRPVKAKDVFAALAAPAKELRKLEVLRFEAERTMNLSEIRPRPRTEIFKTFCELFQIEDHDLCELIHAAVFGSIMMANELDDEAYGRMGALVDALVTTAQAKALPH